VLVKSGDHELLVCNCTRGSVSLVDHQEPAPDSWHVSKKHGDYFWGKGGGERKAMGEASGTISAKN